MPTAKTLNKCFINWYAILFSAVTSTTQTAFEFLDNGAEAVIEVPCKIDVHQEIVRVTAIQLSTPAAGKFTLTVEREQDGTAPDTYAAGESAQQRAYASQINEVHEVLQEFLGDMVGGADGIQATSDGDELQIKAQGTPDMTVKVLPGTGMVSRKLVWVTVATTTALIVAPITNPRIDIVQIGADGDIDIKEGAEAGSPSAPTVDSGYMVLAEIYNRVGETSIKDTDDASNGYITDARTFF